MADLTLLMNKAGIKSPTDRSYQERYWFVLCATPNSSFSHTLSKLNQSQGGRSILQLYGHKMGKALLDTFPELATQANRLASSWIDDYSLFFGYHSLTKVHFYSLDSIVAFPMHNGRTFLFIHILCYPHLSENGQKEMSVGWTRSICWSVPEGGKRG